MRHGQTFHVRRDIVSLHGKLRVTRMVLCGEVSKRYGFRSWHGLAGTRATKQNVKTCRKLVGERVRINGVGNAIVVGCSHDKTAVVIELSSDGFFKIPDES